MLRRAMNDVRRFHDDEDGIESLQVVMIIAIAALVLIAVFTVGKEVVDWMKEKWGELKDKQVE